jgi:alpha-glucosidase (family GH31 glycosyl hydrolase)
LLLTTLLTSGMLGADLAAQEQNFSATPEYQAMLTELGRKAVRPSRMISGERKPAAVAVEAVETTQGLRIETVVWRLEISKSPWRLALTNKHTGITWNTAAADSPSPGISWVPDVDAKPAGSPLRLREIQEIHKQENLWTMSGHVEGASEPVNLELAVMAPNLIRLSIEGSKLGDKAGLSLALAGPGPFYGLGERFVKAKLDGQKIALHPEDKLGTPGHDWTYNPAPFMFTPLGLGLYLDTAAQSVFDLTQAERRQFTIQLRNPVVDCYFFIGDPEVIIENYTSITGRTPLPPPWGLGVWVTSLQGANPVLKDAARLRAAGIPASALWVWDVMDDQSNHGWGFWTVGYYGQPGEFNPKLHQLGFKVLGYVHPYVRPLMLPFNTPSPTFEEGMRNHYLVLKPNGQPAGPSFEPLRTANIDFTNPAAVDWWEKMLRRIVVDYGFDGWMEDFGERVDDTDRFSGGRTGRGMANLFPLLYHKITYEVARKLKPDVVEFSRSGYSGSQASSRVMWGGDQLPDWSLDQGYPSVIAAGITSGFCGFAIWGPDILSSSTSKELWIRWTEFGALTPVMRDHLWDKPKFAVDLWFDGETIDTFRRYARLHTSLFPYLYTYAHHAAETGLPVMRHPLLEFPDDPKTYDAEHEYLLGEKLLVAPVVTEGARTRLLYLPRGAWVDYWTGQVLEGGRVVEVPAPLEHIPILVRAGSVIPLADPDIETLAEDLAGNKYRTHGHDLHWRVFPAGVPTHESFVNYDGTTAKADQDAGTFQVAVEHSPTVRPYEVILPLAKLPREVTLGSKRLGQLDDVGYRAREQGWWLNTDAGTLHVLFLADNFILEVVER